MRPPGDSAVGSALTERRADGLTWLEAAGKGWQVAFTTRLGGISMAPFDTLNLSFAVGDDASKVLTNRGSALGTLGAPGLSRLVVPAQVHGSAVCIVRSEHAGRGAEEASDAIAATDALLTATAGLSLMVSVADCVPVLVAAQTSAGGAAIALVHAGWRGMAGGVIAAACAALGRLGRLTAAVVGPSIGRCCFTVGEDVGSLMAARFPGVWRAGRVDLWECARREVEGAGLSAAAVQVPGLCTSCDRRFFSHRRDRGRTGRQAAIAWIGDEERTVPA